MWKLFIIPIIMIVFGLYFRRGGPKKVNWWIGYRTSMASKNQETWVFAHKYVGKLWVPFGFIFAIFSIGAIILAEHGTLLAGIGMAQFIAFCLITFIPVETALRKEFDKNGERK